MPSTPDFNLIAPAYDRLAQLVYGNAQRRAQAHFLPLIPPEARVLVVGGGSGWILGELLRQSHPAYVLYLEASSVMLAKAQEKPLAFPAQVEFRLGTQAQLLPEEKFHVVLTPFVLDLFTPPEAFSIMQRLDKALYPGGLWLHTDFHQSSSFRRQLWQKPLLWGMYRFFRWVSRISGQGLPPFEALFIKLGYKPRQEASFYKGFIKAQVFQKRASPPSPTN
ncbi:class I SAM-dependent methyltransferase [Rufibacter glacialis]|uniref:Class I SAM-dependent methyltransferase n=1 Tax=Rufibacter glacialis TaxID=1259555 RepID=A0A5M8QMM1_9BACT|nr:class I SAM-dependent methyltransferase [Rufibacter glacialis]KAA6437467.1 class I SAM-dependent methyltransferase [Rufibacter glacialis]GGK59124.1 hypothetical protein GCM10011405_03950 [Rufibacter glacialis]